MAFNPAMADVNSGELGARPTVVPVRWHSAGPNLDPGAHQRPIFYSRQDSIGGQDPDERSRKIPGRLQRDVDKKFIQSGDLRSSGQGLRSDYRYNGLAVFSLAAFEAQLFVQERDKTDQPQARHREGIELYQDIRKFLERALATSTNEYGVVESDGDIQHFNILA